jgi:hypothetical protein
MGFSKNKWQLQRLLAKKGKFKKLYLINLTNKLVLYHIVLE